MPTCKKCGSGRAVKNGVVGGRQRYRCKECGCNHRVGDRRTDDGTLDIELYRWGGHGLRRP